MRGSSTLGGLGGALGVVVLAAVLGLVLGGCLEPKGGGSGDPKVDSVTHFLSACVTDAQCPDDLECRCGVCTTGCEATSECAALSEDATCVAASTLEACEVLPAFGPSICAIPCAVDAACGALECGLDRCYGVPECPPGYSYDERVAYCVGPWTEIPSFSGDQRCGPEYYFVELPIGMNEFRPREPSIVTGGFIAALSNREQDTLWSISPNGETNNCNNLWGDDLGTWFQGIRRTVGDVPTRCDTPQIPPPLAFFFRGCGIYDFHLEGRALVPPLNPEED